MRSILERFCVAAALLVTAVSVKAHHSPTMYDRERTITLRGVVVKYEWASPHVYIEIDTEAVNDDNRVWVIEGGGPVQLRRQGWSSSSLALGDRVIVEALGARDTNRKAALGLVVETTDGTRLGMARSVEAYEVPAGPLVANELSGLWLTPRSPRNIEIYYRFWEREPSSAYTEKGNAAIANYDGSQNPGLECVPHPPPYVTLLPRLTSIEIGDEVTLIRRENGVERIVHMNVDSHQGAPRTNQGHSIGWWEEDVLVVDTTHFADHRNGHGYGLPSGTQKHVVERFLLSPDRTRLIYSFSVEDSE